MFSRMLSCSLSVLSTSYFLHVDGWFTADTAKEPEATERGQQILFGKRIKLKLFYHNVLPGTR